MTFQIHALDAAAFAPLFALSDKDLAAQGGVRVLCTASPDMPCRVSLQDAEVGEEVILVNHEHQPAPTPFRASHAIFVRRGARTAHPGAGEIPQALRRRTLSLRAFDAEGMMRTADLAEGRDAGETIERMFADPAVAYLHAHYARPGCFAARIDRA